MKRRKQGWLVAVTFLANCLGGMALPAPNAEQVSKYEDGAKPGETAITDQAPVGSIWGRPDRGPLFGSVDSLLGTGQPSHLIGDETLPSYKEPPKVIKRPKKVDYGSTRSLATSCGQSGGRRLETSSVCSLSVLKMNDKVKTMYAARSGIEKYKLGSAVAGTVLQTAVLAKDLNDGNGYGATSAGLNVLSGILLAFPGTQAVGGIMAIASIVVGFMSAAKSYAPQQPQYPSVAEFSAAMDKVVRQVLKEQDEDDYRKAIMVDEQTVANYLKALARQGDLDKGNFSVGLFLDKKQKILNYVCGEDKNTAVMRLQQLATTIKELADEAVEGSSGTSPFSPSCHFQCPSENSQWSEDCRLSLKIAGDNKKTIVKFMSYYQRLYLQSIAVLAALEDVLYEKKEQLGKEFDTYFDSEQPVCPLLVDHNFRDNYKDWFADSVSTFDAASGRRMQPHYGRGMQTALSQCFNLEDQPISTKFGSGQTGSELWDVFGTAMNGRDKSTYRFASDDLNYLDHALKNDWEKLAEERLAEQFGKCPMSALTYERILERSEVGQDEVVCGEVKRPETEAGKGNVKFISGPESDVGFWQGQRGPGLFSPLEQGWVAQRRIVGHTTCRSHGAAPCGATYNEYNCLRCDFCATDECMLAFRRLSKRCPTPREVLEDLGGRLEDLQERWGVETPCVDDKDCRVSPYSLEQTPVPQYYAHKHGITTTESPTCKPDRRDPHQIWGGCMLRTCTPATPFLKGGLHPWSSLHEKFLGKVSGDPQCHEAGATTNMCIRREAKDNGRDVEQPRPPLPPPSPPSPPSASPRQPAQCRCFFCDGTPCTHSQKAIDFERDQDRAPPTCNICGAPIAGICDGTGKATTAQNADQTCFGIGPENPDLGCKCDSSWPDDISEPACPTECETDDAVKNCCETHGGFPCRLNGVGSACQSPCSQDRWGHKVPCGIKQACPSTCSETTSDDFGLQCCLSRRVNLAGDNKECLLNAVNSACTCPFHRDASGNQVACSIKLERCPSACSDDVDESQGDTCCHRYRGGPGKDCYLNTEKAVCTCAKAGIVAGKSKPCYIPASFLDTL